MESLFFNKISPLCPVFSVCGGCQYQDISYEDELHLKQGELKKIFQDALKIPDEILNPILPSPQPYFYAESAHFDIVPPPLLDNA